MFTKQNINVASFYAELSSLRFIKFSIPLILLAFMIELIDHLSVYNIVIIK